MLQAKRDMSQTKSSSMQDTHWAMIQHSHKNKLSCLLIWEDGQLWIARTAPIDYSNSGWVSLPLKKQGELCLSLEVCWRIDGSAHPCFTVSAIFRPCEHVCCQPLAPRGPKPLACPPSIVSCLFKVLISCFQRCSLNQNQFYHCCVFFAPHLTCLTHV